MAEDAKVNLGEYDPDKLLNFLIGKLSLKNDAALCRVLNVLPPQISKISSRRLMVSDSMLIRMHEMTDVSIRKLKSMMGAWPQDRSRPSPIPI